VNIEGGPFGEQLEALRLIGDRLAGGTPFVQTVFSPLAVVGRLTNSDLSAVRGYMREAPQALHGALAAIAETLGHYVTACLKAGADGVFFASVDWGTYDNCSREEYAEFGRPHDLQVLQAAEGAWFNVLHICRRNNMLLDLLDYPVHAFNWAVGLPGNPSLADVLSKTGKAVMGGLNERATLLSGSPADVQGEAQKALADTAGRRFLLAPGCSISPQTPEANLRAAVEVAHSSAVGADSPGGEASL
jgi:uroporphyrinogen decarboxylase